MRLRRFNGSDTASALRRVKETLGAEAVILATRALPAGGVEITAAVDDDRVVAAPQPPLPAPDDLGTIARELRELGVRVRDLDRALRPSCIAASLGGEGRTLAERLVLAGLAPGLCGAVATSFEAARRAGMAAGAALERSLAAHLLPATAPSPARIAAFVGATGTGKTTTIAKLAAAQVRAGRRRLGLIMADTYRVGAAEQLAAYARMLGVPMAVVRDPGELAAAVERFADRDAIYVDTAGLGGDPDAAASTRALLAAAGETLDVTAVISAATGEGALVRSWRQLVTLAPRRCVVTKLDESAALGGACSWVAENGLALSWLGIGQRVPEDLAAASGSALVRWLLAA